jgi:hypothetical protein
MVASNTYGRQVVEPLTNKSGGGVIAGDVVVVDTANNDAFTTSTAGSFLGLVGIAMETIANNATGRVLTSGYAPLVNVNASVTLGHYGKTYTVAKQATDAGASRATGGFCQFLTGGTTPDAHLFGMPDGSSASGSVATDAIWTAAGQIALGTGTSSAVAAALSDYLPWHVSLIPMVWTPDATTGTWVATGGATDSGFDYPFYTPGSVANSGAANRVFNSSNAQNDAIAWDVVLGAGTWDCHFWVRKGTGNAIYTLNQDGSSMGTVDTYAAAAAFAKVSITGWTVTTVGKKRMQVLAATKNASSSGYSVNFFAIEFRRTA